MTNGMMIVGVGGQGSLLASRLMGSVLSQAGYEVKLSEIHGMSQRGGSVVTHIRWGDEVHAPLCDVGEADYVVSFELLEAARALPNLKRGGTIVTSTQEIRPMPVITGVMPYPANLIGQLQDKADVVALDALSMAERAGHAKCANVVLMGALSLRMSFPLPLWEEGLRRVVPPQMLEMNQLAFQLGRQYAETIMQE